MEPSNNSGSPVTEYPTNVARQDSGVPEDLASPTTLLKSPDIDEDLDGTMCADCEVTVIHVTPESAATKRKESLRTDNKEARDFPVESKDTKDGSDSGVEGCAAEPARARSRNSVDYASSCGGLDEASCDSSLVSCCSVYEDPCATLPDDLRLTAGGEGTSEGGSESSSVAGSVSARGTRPPNAGKRTATTSAASKKKLTATEPQRPSRAKPVASGCVVATTPRSKARAVAPRALAASRDRGRSRESKPASLRDPATSCREPTPTITQTLNSNGRPGATPRPSSTSTAPRSRTRAIPDSLPSALTNEINKDLAQRGRGAGQRAGSSTRGRTPGSTPSDESGKLLGTPRTEPRSARKERVVPSSETNKASDSFATLPRRNRSKFTVLKPSEKTSRSRSGSRDATLGGTVGKKSTPARDAATPYKNLPPYPRNKPTERTRIYHETGVQTGLTGDDVERVLAGLTTSIPDPATVERLESSCQTEATWEDVQLLRAEAKRAVDQAAENERLKAELADVRRALDEEKTDHAFARQELDRNAQRVLAMLGTPQSEHAEGDSFLELESHIQSSGQVVANQQIEIEDLQSLCRMLNRDLEKSIAAQKTLLQQQQELEAESMEMQDFLQEEKTTLVESLKEAETEIKRKDEMLRQSKSELARQIEECKHLVRISEQRRQENLSMNLKLNAVERRCRDLLLSQGAAVSGAAVALSGLGTRLEGLVDQLVTSYNISEKDLEDVIYHNEAYSRSNSSVESSPVSSRHSLKEFTPSPKRGSFVSAVIGAIRNAATHPFAGKLVDKKPVFVEPFKQLHIKDSPLTHPHLELSLDSSTELLDFETEPCLMMESVLEDVPLPDTYSHNMVSSSDSLRRALGGGDIAADESNGQNRFTDESTSLSNLTQAILRRRKVEDEEEEDDDNDDDDDDNDDCESLSERDGVASDNPGTLADYCPAVSLVDRVIDVDNLVTKLLKVLRIIQLDNDTCIQELRDEKSSLESKLEIGIAELEELKKLAGVLQNDKTASEESCRISTTQVSHLPPTNQIEGAGR